MLFRSKTLSLKRDHEQCALVTLYKKVAVSKSLSSLLTKEWHEWFPHFLKLNHTFALSFSKNKQLARKMCSFNHAFEGFFLLLLTFLYPRANCSRRSLHRHSFYRATGVIRSWKKPNCYFALSITKNEPFALRTKERIPNPGNSNDLYFYWPTVTNCSVIYTKIFSTGKCHHSFEFFLSSFIPNSKTIFLACFVFPPPSKSCHAYAVNTLFFGFVKQ